MPPRTDNGGSSGAPRKLEAIHVAAAAVAVGAAAVAVGAAAVAKFNRLVEVFERWERKTPDLAHGRLDIAIGSNHFQLHQGNAELIAKTAPTGDVTFMTSGSGFNVTKNF